MPIINLLKSKLNNNGTNQFNNKIGRCTSSYGNNSSNCKTIETFNLIEELFGDFNDNNNTNNKTAIKNYHNDDDNDNNFSHDYYNNIDSNSIKNDITESSSSSTILLLSHLDGIDAIIPTQCLLALGMFCNGSINTYEQR